MDADQTCDIFLSNLKRSNQNFSLSETPFSVEIKIRKTFIKEKSGIVRFSGFSSETNIENKKVRDENTALRAALDNRDDEIHSLKKAILEKAKLKVSKTLSDNLVKTENADVKVIDQKLTHHKSLFKNLKSEMIKVEKEISEKEVEIEEPKHLNIPIKNFFDPLLELKDFECYDFQNTLNKHDTKIIPTTFNNRKRTSSSNFSRTPPPPLRTPPSPFRTPPPPLLSKSPPPLRSPSSPQTPQTCPSTPSCRTSPPASSTSPPLVTPAQCEHIPQCQFCQI